MNTNSSWNRLPLLFGGALLVACLAGASIYLQTARPLDAGPQDEVTEKNSRVGLGVVCIGKVDLQTGLLQLSPEQMGSVVEISTRCVEGQAVKKGEALLRVNDVPFVHAIAQAEAAVGVAKTQLQQAEQWLKRFPELVAAQKAGVGAARAKFEAASEKLKQTEKYTTLNIPQAGKEDVLMAQKLVKAAEELAAVEEAKLRELMASGPEAKIAEAQKNIELRSAQLDQAREAHSRCTLVAPQDGVVLQVQAQVGTQFGPQSHTPAVIFAPNVARIIRVEIDQEFAGRVALNAAASIQDEANVGPTWQGKVIRIGDVFLKPRSDGGPDLMSASNSNRVLEAIVAIDGEPKPATMPRLGQRMRVSIAATGK